MNEWFTPSLQYSNDCEPPTALVALPVGMCCTPKWRLHFHKVYTPILQYPVAGDKKFSYSDDCEPPTALVELPVGIWCTPK